MAVLFSAGMVSAEERIMCPFINVSLHCEGKVPAAFGLHLRDSTNKERQFSGGIELSLKKDPGGPLKPKFKLGGAVTYDPFYVEGRVIAKPKNREYGGEINFGVKW